MGPHHRVKPGRAGGVDVEADRWDAGERDRSDRDML